MRYLFIFSFILLSHISIYSAAQPGQLPEQERLLKLARAHEKLAQALKERARACSSAKVLLASREQKVCADDTREITSEIQTVQITPPVEKKNLIPSLPVATIEKMALRVDASQKLQVSPGPEPMQYTESELEIMSKSHH